MNKEKAYHQARRMFFMIDKKLVLADRGYGGCHFDWLLDFGFSENKAKDFIEKELRGVIDPTGDIKFFTGENWEINEKIEKDFFEIFSELVSRAEVKPEARVLGGAIRQEVGKVWPARKEYGRVGEIWTK